MKICVIAGLLEGQKTGIGTYTYNLLKTFNEIETGFETFTVSRQELDLFTGSSNNSIIIPTLNIFNKIQSGFFAWQFLILPLNLRKYRQLSLVHDPFNLACFALFDVPFKKVVTIHDISPVVNKNNFKRLFVFIHQVMLPKVVKKSDIVITDSEFSKSEILKHLKCDLSKIRIIYPGINVNLHPVSFGQFKPVLGKYKVPAKFILYVGAMHRQKNVQALLRAFARIKGKVSEKIVIVGPKIYGGKGELSKLIRDLDLESDVYFTGYIRDDELSVFYSAASVFVFPSLYEGFGLPPLEAMACGTPVISSNRTSLPEAVGDA